MVRRLIILVIMSALVGCGLSKEEHDKLVQGSLDEQKGRFDQEMKKAQKACDDDLAATKKQNAEVVSSKDQMIAGLEREVQKTGGDLKKVREELGARATELASTKTNLASTKTTLAATNKELDQLRRLREQAEKEAAQFKAIAQRLKSMIDAGKLSVVMRDGRINLKLPDNVLFPSGSKKLKKDGMKALSEVAAVLRDVGDREFLIAGHTDNVPVRRGGAFKSNWSLSTARAVTVVELLIKNGVSPKRLAAAGFGEFDPIVTNETKEGRAQNRRLEIILLPNLEQVNL